MIRQGGRGGWSRSRKGESLPSEALSPWPLKPHRMQAEDKERRSGTWDHSLEKPWCWAEQRWEVSTSISDVTLKQEFNYLEVTLRSGYLWPWFIPFQRGSRSRIGWTKSKHPSCIRSPWSFALTCLPDWALLTWAYERDTDFGAKGSESEPWLCYGLTSLSLGFPIWKMGLICPMHKIPLGIKSNTNMQTEYTTYTWCLTNDSCDFYHLSLWVSISPSVSWSQWCLRIKCQCVCLCVCVNCSVMSNSFATHGL